MRRTILLLAALCALVSCRNGGLGELRETVTIDGSVGRLVGDVLRPATSAAKVPTAIIYHGLTGWRTEVHLRTVADSLLAEGIAVVLFDFNGHGESEGDFVNMTLDNEFEDALRIYDYVASLPWVDTKRISLIGHSQGGLEAGLAAGALGAEKVYKLVLLAPAACIHTMAVEGSLFGYKLGDGEFPEYIDFWKGLRLGRAYLESAYNLDVYGRTAGFTGPAIIVQGLADSPELIRDAEAYTRYLKDVKYIPLEGLTHGYSENLALPASLTARFLAE